MADLYLEHYRLGDLTTATGSLVSALDPKWHEEINEPGYSSFAAHKDDPILGLISLPNSLVSYLVDATVAFTMLIEGYEAIDIPVTTGSEGEDAPAITTFTGQGVGALIDRIIWWPSLGVKKKPVEEDIKCDWTSFDYDDSGWAAATLICTVGDVQTGGGTDWGGGANKWDDDFPSPTANILGPSTATVITALPGVCYFRQPVVIAEDGVRRLSGLMDNYGEYDIDGVQILTVGQTQDGTMTAFQQTVSATIELTAGLHVVAWRVVNFPITGNNPMGGAWTLEHLDATGTVLGLDAQSDVNYALVVEYPATPPGMTPGQAVLIGLNKAADRAGPADVLSIANILSTATWDEFTDSNSNDWPVVANMATKVGTKIGQFLRELSVAHIDWRVVKDGGEIRLDLYRKGEMTTTPGVTFEPPTDPDDESTGNLVAKRRIGEA